MIKFVDMFSGIGGFREGLTRAGGFECVGHCEIDKYANRSYNALFDTKGEWFIEDARKADPSAIYEFWNMEQLLDASRDSSFDCIVFPNYCNSHNSVVCSLSCGYNRFPLVEHDPRYTLIVRDILYWETARSLWAQYLKAIPGKEEKVKRAIRGILADYEKEERDIIYLESKNHCVLVHLDGIRQTPEGSPSFYATLDEAEHEFASSASLSIAAR